MQFCVEFFERMVERAYENYLVEQCNAQTAYKKQLQKNARLVRNPVEKERKQKKAAEFTLTRCEELQELYPGRNERKRSAYGRY